MVTDKEIVGVDLGGTKIMTALIKGNEIVKISDNSTEQHKNKTAILQNLITAIDDVITGNTIGIGIGLPGILNPDTGIVHDIVNIRAWNGINLIQELNKHFRQPIRINNDANCFALGSQKFGIAKEFKNVVALSIGTGLGAGIICDGKIYGGLNNGAGEFGQIPYLDSVYERYCSGQFFSEVKNLKGETLYNKASEGDKKAMDIWAEYGSHLGNIIINVLYSLAPEAIIFGGSVSSGFSFFRKEIEKKLNALPIRNVADNIKLRVETNPDIAVLGAAALCL
jgi:glucokinase